jgi:hypothetical protein
MALAIVTDASVGAVLMLKRGRHGDTVQPPA